MNYITHKLNKIIFGTLIASCPGFLCYSSIKNDSNNNSQQESIDKIVAIVNDDVITDSELNNKALIVHTQLAKQSRAQSNKITDIPPYDEIKKQILNNMILETLQLQVAKINNINVTPDQIEAAINNIAAQNNMSLEQFKKKLASDGISYANFKSDITKQITMLNTQRSLAQNEVKITPKELEQEIQKLTDINIKNNYKVSHILISVPNPPTSEQIISAKKKADRVMQDLKKGKDFSSVAMVASDSQEALKGGDIGWYNHAELPQMFAEVIPKLSKNQIFGPIQNESGFHIIKLTDIKYDNKKFQEEQYKVRHILVKNDEITSNIIAEQELSKLRKEILGKNNFSDLALIYSEDVGSASKGGDLGWISANTVVPEFAKVIQSLKPNEISEPFKTPYGWHIVKLEGVKKVDNTIAWQKNQARQILENRKFQEAIVSWQNKLRSESHIKILI